MHPDIISKLKLFSAEHPEFNTEICTLIFQLQRAGPSGRESIMKRFLLSHKALSSPLKEFLAQNCGKRFCVFDPEEAQLQNKLRQATGNEHLKIWAATIESVPRYTKVIPDVNKDFIGNAHKSWDAAVCGNEDVLKCLLRHAVEYSRTGKTSAVLLNGPPGIGKTLISRVYSSILQLPFSFISGPGASVRRGLSGDPALYTNAGPGAIVQSMISGKAGNPCICVDELDKALGGHTSRPNFQHELLGALDDSNVEFYDNYLETCINASYIPYIFTSNNKDVISVPLLDRMEIIEMAPPTKETLLTIVQKHTLPNVLKMYDADGIQIEENTIDTLVDQLWSGGSRSCRPYKKAVDRLISDAYRTLLETDRPVTVTPEDAKSTANQFRQEQFCKPIGFRTA